MVIGMKSVFPWGRGWEEDSLGEDIRELFEVMEIVYILIGVWVSQVCTCCQNPLNCAT